MKKDPYFVASSDGPHLILMTVQLKDNHKDNNYEERGKSHAYGVAFEVKIRIHRWLDPNTNRQS